MNKRDNSQVEKLETSLDLVPTYFPFKRVNNKDGIKFRSEQRRPGSMEGFCVDIAHNGHDHLVFDFRDLYKTESGKQGNRRRMLWSLDTGSTVQLASILFYLADEHMRGSDEQPYYSIVASKDKASMGPNWINEDFQTAAKRTALRKSRSHLFSLMKRFVECCESEQIINTFAQQLISWADNHSEDAFAQQIARQVESQLSLVPNISEMA